MELPEIEVHSAPRQVKVVPVEDFAEEVRGVGYRKPQYYAATFEEIGRAIGVKRARAHAIYLIAMKKIRRDLGLEP